MAFYPAEKYANHSKCAIGNGRKRSCANGRSKTGAGHVLHVDRSLAVGKNSSSILKLESCTNLQFGSTNCCGGRCRNMQRRMGSVSSMNSICLKSACLVRA